LAKGQEGFSGRPSPDLLKSPQIPRHHYETVQQEVGMLRVLVQSLSVFLLLVVAWSAMAQEGPWAGLRPLGADEIVVFLKVQKTEGDGLMTVPLDHRFSPNDHFVFEVSPSRGGYVALYGLGPDRRLKQRVWPSEASGYPVTAQSFTRLPPVHSLSLSGQGPTRLALLFSLTPLVGGGPPSPSAAIAPVSPRRWLKQIRLRDVVLNQASLPDVPTAIYQGKLPAGEPVGVLLELASAEKHP
jgi:hypothetical protein